MCQIHAQQAGLNAQVARVDVRATVGAAHQIQLLVTLVGARWRAITARVPIRGNVHVVTARGLPHVAVAAA